jgi:hypothetical protein
VTQVIACPNCDKKLALRDELKGRTLVCPQCNGRFTAPTDDSPGDVYGMNSAEAASPGGADMDFFDSLGASSGPNAARQATRNSATARPSTSSAGSPASSSAAGSAAARAKSKNDQMLMIYLGGGVAGVILIVVVIALFATSGGSGRNPKKAKDQNIRFGMTETQRRQLYEDLIHAVDENGMSKETQKEWRLLGKDYKLTDQHIVDVLEEGLKNQDWEQPAMTASMDQRHKKNRTEWFLKRDKIGHEPIMAL